MLWEILVPREMVEATHSIPSSSLPKPSQGYLGPKDLRSPVLGGGGVAGRRKHLWERLKII